MIELPRACLVADKIAAEAEFFSFGTNDLTQTTFGISRDDCNKFLPAYLQRGIFKQDPFAVLDQEGRWLADQNGHQQRARGASRSEDRDLRRARRRARIGEVLPSGGAGLCILLAVPAADGSAGGGSGGD